MKITTSFFDLAKGITLLTVCLVFVIKVWSYDVNSNNGHSGLDETTIIKIAENVAKAQVVANNDRIDDLIKELKIQNSKALAEANKNKETITEVGMILASLKSGIEEIKSSFLYKDPKEPSKDVDFTQVQREACDGSKFPTADVYYSPNLEGDNKWTINTHPLSFHANVVETETEDGEFNRYVELNIENKRIPSLRGKLFPTKIDKLRWEKIEITDKKFSFNPRLSFGVSITDEDIYPNLGLSLFSYGRTKRDIDWRFITLGGGGAKNKLCLGLTPISYNTGNFIPIVENLFIGPNISINDDSELSYGGDISVPF